MCALFQLAHYKTYGEIPRLVETIDMSHFTRGRVAWIITNTLEATAFVRHCAASSLPLADDSKALELLRSAADAYKDCVAAAVSGKVMPQIGELVRILMLTLYS